MPLLFDFKYSIQVFLSDLVPRMPNVWHLDSHRISLLTLPSHALDFITVADGLLAYATYIVQNLFYALQVRGHLGNRFLAPLHNLRQVETFGILIVRFSSCQFTYWRRQLVLQIGGLEEQVRGHLGRPAIFSLASNQLRPNYIIL